MYCKETEVATIGKRINLFEVMQCNIFLLLECYSGSFAADRSLLIECRVCVCSTQRGVPMYSRENIVNAD